MRTLVVDDSPVIRILLQRLLASYGECVPTPDGQEAVDTYCRSLSEGRPFDLVCLDLGLQGISGVSVLEQIRAAEAQCVPEVRARVLVITASTAVSDVDAVRRQGADGYMVKPINGEKLVEYMSTFGLLCAPAQAEAPETPIERIEAMCGLDTIPVPVLTRLIQRMAGSINRQVTTQSTSDSSREYQ